MVNKNPDLFQSPGLNRLKPLDPLQKMVFKWDPGTPKSKVTKLLAASLAWLSSSFKVAFFAPPVWQSILYLFIAAKAHHNPQILKKTYLGNGLYWGILGDQMMFWGDAKEGTTTSETLLWSTDSLLNQRRGTPQWQDWNKQGTMSSAIVKALSIQASGKKSSGWYWWPAWWPFKVCSDKP